MPVAAPPRPPRPPAPRVASQPGTVGRSVQAGRPEGRIRWDRVGRIALLALLAIVLAVRPLGLFGRPA